MGLRDFGFTELFTFICCKTKCWGEISVFRHYLMRNSVACTVQAANFGSQMKGRAARRGGTEEVKTFSARVWHETFALLQSFDHFIILSALTTSAKANISRSTFNKVIAVSKDRQITKNNGTLYRFFLSGQLERPPARPQSGRPDRVAT